jgi:AcrR family transcriptional regulator
MNSMQRSIFEYPGYSLSHAPAAPLGAKLKPTRPGLPREFIAAHKRRRMTDAIASLCAEQGYEATKIADIVSRAGVARKTLYDNFDGKEDLFLAALEAFREDLIAAIEGACVAGEDWSKRIEAALGAFLATVAEQPQAAKMAMIEALSATPTAAARYDRALHGFVELLRRSVPSELPRSVTLEETLVGGVAWIVNQQIRRGEAAQARDLLPELSEFVLSPYHRVAEIGSYPGRESDSTVADSSP